MKQILLRSGRVSVEDVPAPALQPKIILVEVSKSLISTGTELSSVQMSGRSLLEKAVQKPEMIGKVLHSIRVRGLAKTFSLIQQTSDQSQALGYSCAGTVLAVGADVKNFRAGDRVACAGSNLANHAEVVGIPENLAVKIPHGVNDTNASFVTLGAIALQGVRRADLRLGESVCVVGLGLVGQLTVQLLVASGCRVFGMDPEVSRVELAKAHGLGDGATSLEELEKKILLGTAGQGADATLLTASTDDSLPTQQAFQLTRKKGRVVVVGSVGLNLRRSPFYEKEQDFLIACSYGPGRYDPRYEMEGQDYPFAYVRWTENRNMAAFLDLVAKGKIDLAQMVVHEVPMEKSGEAYQILQSSDPSRPLAVVLSYQSSQLNFVKSASVTQLANPVVTPGKIRLALIGVGDFVKSTHLPNLKTLEEKFVVVGVATAHGATAHTWGRQLKAAVVSTNPLELIHDSRVDAVLIGTRHNTHAALAEEALRSGKHIYLEKPLALTSAELESLDKTVRGLSSCPTIMVGFNRRFSPLTEKLKAVLHHRKSPMVAVYRINAGPLPADHWIKTTEGGGRLRGEACHMIDLFRCLVKSPIKTLQIEGIYPTDVSPLRPDENFSAQLSYEDGSLCTLIYTSLGDLELPKEKLEVHWDGLSAVLDDFQALHVFGDALDLNLGRPNKGHQQALQVFAQAVQSGISFPVPWEELVETTQACVQLDSEIWGRMT